MILNCDPHKIGMFSQYVTTEKANRFVFKAGSLVFKMLTKKREF